MIRVADIQRVVAAAYGASVAELKEPDGLGARLESKVRPRQIAMFLARTHCRHPYYGDGTQPLSLSEIGRRFGNRDHTTVRYAVSAIAEKRQKSKKLDIVISSIERQLEAVDKCSPKTFFNAEGGA